LLPVTRFEDREYLIEAEYAEATARLLVDLSTQERSTLPPEDAWLQCAQHLDPCWTKQADELMVHFGYALESGVWTSGQERTHRLPFEGAVSDLGRGDVIVVGQDKVARLDGDTGDSELLASFEPRNV
jgi:hypothetical protein